MTRFLLAIIVAGVYACAPAETMKVGVDVAVGPTPILRGDATGPRDITVSNGLFAVAFAADSAPPWGVARGGIIDIALLSEDGAGYDIASLADFMPDNWSDWPTTYQKVTVEQQTRDQVVIRTLRDWGEVELDTRFRIVAGDSRIHIVTRMTNAGEETLERLLSGYVVWPDGGHLIESPIAALDSDREQWHGWTAAYDATWMLGLHAPFAESAMRRGRDRYTSHDLRPGQMREFEAWLQIEAGGSLAPMAQAEAELRGLESGRLVGTVTTGDGEVVVEPAVIINQGGELFAWTVGEGGEYAIELPVGDYELRATAQRHAPGATVAVEVKAGVQQRVDFGDVIAPGSVAFGISDAADGRPLDARIEISSGYKPLIGFFGKDTFFTELDHVGALELEIAPGEYVFEVSAGGGFTSVPQTVEAKIASGETVSLQAGIDVVARPAERGWYSADLHHHSDVLDGFTDPEFVVRSELAAGVDITFLSDHDSVINNAAMQALSAARDTLFLPGTELSPSWAHFNTFPVDSDKNVEIDTGQASVQQVFAEARRLGGDVIQVNHPYSDYGYFENADAGRIPGGYDDSFDLVEIGPATDNQDVAVRNVETLVRTYQYWNRGRKVYLAAGSDVHDVWRFESARARTYAYVEGELTIDKFVRALESGHSYASQGPLIYPEILFGSEVSLARGDELRLRFQVEAAHGVGDVQLIERGRSAGHRDAGRTGLIDVEFAVRPDADTWYSLAVTDGQGRQAFTNPVWVRVTD